MTHFVVFIAVWCFMWFVCFCFLTDAWRNTKETKLYGQSHVRAAIAFSFFSVIPWVSIWKVYSLYDLKLAVTSMRCCGLWCVRTDPSHLLYALRDYIYAQNLIDRPFALTSLPTWNCADCSGNFCTTFIFCALNSKLENKNVQSIFILSVVLFHVRNFQGTTCIQRQRWIWCTYKKTSKKGPFLEWAVYVVSLLRASKTAKIRKRVCFWLRRAEILT